MKNLELGGQIRCIMGDVLVAYWFPIWISLDWLRLVYKISKFVVYGAIINEIPPLKKSPKFTVNYIDVGNSKLIHLFSLIFKFSNMAECTMFNIDRISNTNLRSAHSDNADFITHGLVLKVPSVLNLTCFQFFTISDPAAALSSIMLFLLSDTVHMKGMTTGWSKIPGGPTGEWKATSWCRGTRITNVELPQAPAILLFNLRASKNLACPQPVFLSFDSLRAREHFLFFPPHPHSLAHAVY